MGILTFEIESGLLQQKFGFGNGLRLELRRRCVVAAVARYAAATTIKTTLLLHHRQAFVHLFLALAELVHYALIAILPTEIVS